MCSPSRRSRAWPKPRRCAPKWTSWTCRPGSRSPAQARRRVPANLPRMPSPWRVTARPSSPSASTAPRRRTPTISSRSPRRSARNRSSRIRTAVRRGTRSRANGPELARSRRMRSATGSVWVLGSSAAAAVYARRTSKKSQRSWTTESSGMTEHCPECNGTVTRIGSGPQWCMACEWNLGAFEPPHGVAATRARRRDHRLAFAINRRLFAELGAQRPERPGWTTARVGLLATSIALLVFDLGLVGFGVYLVVTGWSLVKVVGVFLLLLGIELRPRLPRLPKGAEMLSRSGHSRLYALVDAVGERIGAPPIDGVVVNETYNASCNRYGLRRRRILTIGMPLWAALGPDARIALLGHELGHLINADPGMSLLTQPALTTFGRLARIFHPQGMIRAGAYRTGAD